MMMKTGVFLLILIILSCNNSSEEKTEIKEETKVEKTTEENIHTSETDKVVLDDGKLWEANEDTTIGINKMKSRLNTFKNFENIAAYQTLKDGLEADFTELFQKCTMKGEAHNQLHNYLHPMIDLFEGIGSSNLATCKRNFNALKTHLDTYTSFFK